MARGEVEPSQTPLLEWIAAGVGALFLIGLLGVFGYGAARDKSREPPAIVVETREISQAGASYVVSFKALNTSRGTAAALQVEGQLLEGERLVETSLASIDYVSGHGSADGGLVFTRDPRGLTLKIRPVGYQAP